MANNKVELANGTVLIDLTSDTVDAAHLMQGYTAHDKSGAAIVGTASGGGIPLPSPITAGDTPVITASPYSGIRESSSTGEVLYIIIPKTGTYRFKWSYHTFSTTSRTCQLYKNRSAISGTSHSTLTADWGDTASHDVACTQGDRISVYANGGSSTRAMVIDGFTANINWDNSF